MKGVKKRLSHTEGDLKDTKDIAAQHGSATAASLTAPPPPNSTALNGAVPSNSPPSAQPASHLTSSSSSSAISTASSLPPPSSSASSSSSSDLSHLPRCRLSRSVTRDVIIHNLPALRDAPPSSRKPLLLKKLRLCCFVFSFDDAQLDSAQEQKEKELKRSTLLELVNFLTVFKPSFHDDELSAIFEMVQINLFRPLPPSTFELTGVYNPEEDEPSSEPSWVHLQVLYEFLLRLATSTETDAKLMDKYFTRKFILQLLELFDSEDPRERDYLKTILHRIYGNFMSLRPFIRRAINNVFYRFIYETDRHNGIAELLEILGSIINGFALPLKEQHKQFLIRVLLPLHKVTHVSIFHPQLSYCVTQFLEKDQTLAPAIISAILKFWPLCASKKELMFLNELEEVLDRVQSQHLGVAEVTLFARLADCINSPHFQVSERAIYILNNDIMVRFVQGKKDLLVPILAKRLIGNTAWTDEQEADKLQQLIDQTMHKCRQQAAAATASSPPTSAPATTAASSSSHSSAPSSFSSSPVAAPSTVLSPLLLSPHRLHLGHASAGRPGHWNATIIELTGDLIKVLSDVEGGGGVVDRMMDEREAEVEERVRRGEERVRRWEQLAAASRQWEQERHSGGRAGGNGGKAGEGGMAVVEGGGGGGAGGGGAGAMEH